MERFVIEDSSLVAPNGYHGPNPAASESNKEERTSCRKYRRAFSFKCIKVTLALPRFSVGSQV